MPVSKDRDLPEYDRSLFTPADLLAQYEHEQCPLTYETLRTIVDPLMGTSFGAIMLKALLKKFAEQKAIGAPLPYAMMPPDMYLPFFNDFDDNSDTLKGSEAREAETALWSHLIHNVAGGKAV